MSNYILTDTGELYHFGVKGMKWGVRRNRNISGRIKGIREKGRDMVKKGRNKIENYKNANTTKKYATRTAIGAAAVIGSSLVTSAAVMHMVNKGRMKGAIALAKMAKFSINAGKIAVLAGAGMTVASAMRQDQNSNKKR